MKQIITVITIAFTTILFSQTPEQLEAWDAYKTPSEVHRILAKDVGTWKATVKMWTEPGKAPIETKGTSTISMLLEGRYQQSIYESDYMGMPMKGISTLAFDNATGEFTSTWIDNFGTGMMILKGKFNEEKNQINFTGNMIDPMTGKNLPVREVYSFLDDNTQKMEMFLSMEKKEFKSMEIIFTRAQR